MISTENNWAGIIALNMFPATSLIINHHAVRLPMIQSQLAKLKYFLFSVLTQFPLVTTPANAKKQNANNIPMM